MARSPSVIVWVVSVPRGLLKVTVYWVFERVWRRLWATLPSLPVFSGVECRGEEVASGEYVLRGDGEASGDSGVDGEAVGVALLEEMPEFCLATRGV